MKARMCGCPECRNLDRLHPKEGRQLALIPDRQARKRAQRKEAVAR